MKINFDSKIFNGLRVWLAFVGLLIPLAVIAIWLIFGIVLGMGDGNFNILYFFRDYFYLGFEGGIPAWKIHLALIFTCTILFWGEP